MEHEMSFVQRELERIQTELGVLENNGDQWAKLHAAQQALAWALDPSGYASPFDMIKGNRVDSEDCSAPPHHSPS